MTIPCVFKTEEKYSNKEKECHALIRRSLNEDILFISFDEHQSLRSKVLQKITSQFEFILFMNSVIY